MLRIDINLIFTVVNVLVLCLAVRIFLWKPVHKVLAERQANVDASLADAAKAKTEAEALVEEQKDEILRQAQGEITEIIVAATAKVAGVPVGGDSDLYDEFLKKAGGQHE